MVDPLIAAAADAKVQAALELIEEAQRNLGRACQELCPIIGGAGQWKRVSASYDRVHAEWYRVHAWFEKKRGQLELDESGRRGRAEDLRDGH